MKHVAFIVAGLAGFLLLNRLIVSSGPFAYDEADYAFATTLGIAANYTDHPTLPLRDFLREGLGRGQSPGQRAALSAAIRNSNDIVFYRHWHGPLYFYWLIFDLSVAHGEHSARLGSLLVPILTLLVIYAGCLWISPGPAGGIQAMLGSALFLMSWTTLGSTELAPHQLFATCFLLALFSLVRLVDTARPSYLYLSAGAAALAFCTLELALVLIVTICICALRERRRIGLDWSTGVKACLIFAGTVLVVWPGAILRLSFVKAYLFMAYLALFRKSPWGAQGLLGTWVERWCGSPVEWALIAAAIALYIFDSRIRGDRRLYPFLLFAGLMILATLRVTTGSPRYGLPFMPALQVFAGLVTGSRIVRTSRLAQAMQVAVLTLALIAVGWIQVTRHPPSPDVKLIAALDLIRSRHVTHSTLLAPQDWVPSIHAYFPRILLRGYAGARPAAEEMNAPDLTGILYSDGAVRYERLRP